MHDAPRPDATTTPVLSPPGGAVRQGASGAGQYLWLWIALAAVLVVGLAVIFTLPALLQPSQQVAAPPATALAPGAEARDRANQSMQAYLRLQAALELGQASRWGEPEWSQAQAAADNGARLLAQRQFSAAAHAYEQALQGLQQLDAGRSRRLDAALDTARQALADNQLEKALEQFQRVLAIDADNEDAHAGMVRAQARAELLRHMAAGERAEADDELLTAQQAYRQATQLDAAYQPANAALQRVTEALATRAFQAAMTQALTALDNGQLAAADKALAQAHALRPSDAAVSDARQRLAQARQQAHLSSLRRKASALAAAEDWQAAGEVYRRALAADAAAGFAHTGLETAQARLALNRQFDHYLDDPDRLYATQPLENAETLLATVSRAPADEPKLAKKIATLQRLVSLARTPVTVTLRSDGETAVTIYHVGQLGSFASRQLELLPGTYTVVGSRPGYRDIRKPLRVSPAQRVTELTIQCEEPI